ncbi:Hypothetical predicted protein, partial [Paramuricea clavata]
SPTPDQRRDVSRAIITKYPFLADAGGGYEIWYRYLGDKIKNELRNEKSDPVVLARKRKNADGHKNSTKVRTVVRRGIVNWAPPTIDGEDEASCRAHIVWMQKERKKRQHNQDLDIREKYPFFFEKNQEKPADQNVEGATAKSETSLNKPEQVISTTANTGHSVRGATQVLLQTGTVYALNTENSRSVKSQGITSRSCVSLQRVGERNIRENAQVNGKHKKTEQLKEGDIVIVKNDKTNRNFWRLGKIEELISGDDGMVRAAKVRVSNENGKSDVLRSSIQHLVPLEVGQDSNVDEIKLNQNEKLTVVEDSRENRSRPRRAAAIANELLRGELLKNKLI